MTTQGLPAVPPSKDPALSSFLTAVRNAVLQLRNTTTTTSAQSTSTTQGDSGWQSALASEASTRAAADAAEEAARIAADNTERAERIAADEAEVDNRNNAIAVAIAAIPQTNCADVIALEDIPLNGLVNITDVSGVEGCRLAGKTVGPAHGFVPGGGVTGNVVRVFFEGQYTDTSFVAAGTLYLGTAGVPSTTPATSTGEYTQIVGYTTAAGSITLRPAVSIVLA